MALIFDPILKGFLFRIGNIDVIYFITCERRERWDWNEMLIDKLT
jgi:hypothetical protein